MMSDLGFVDFLYAVIGIASLIGLLIVTSPRPEKPISVRTRHRINRAVEKREGER